MKNIIRTCFLTGCVWQYATPALLFTIVSCAVLSPSTSRAEVLEVSSRSNIFGAGHASPDDTPSPSSGGGGIAPPFVLITAGPGRVLTFQSVTGSVDVNAGSGPNGPDGAISLDTFDVASHNGIAGLKALKFAFLAGVFLDTNEPSDPAPPRLDFTVIGTDFLTLSPTIGQTFYIGDGLTNGGAVQQFHIPATATRLYLGLLDHSGGTAGPGWYNDNSGGFNATFTVPEPVPGDLDGDGFVGITDLNIVLGNWNQSVGTGVWLDGDPSGDGFVGIEDLNIVLGNWNAGTPPTQSGNIPEPGAVGVLGLLGLVVLGRRGPAC